MKNSISSNLIIDLRPKPVPRIVGKSPFKKRLIRGVCEWLAYGAVFVLIVWGTPTALTKGLNTDYPIAAITSSSMWPELKKGDIVFIKGVSGKEDVSVGDIVVYENSKGFTIHRIARMNENTLVTRGDANNVDDAAVAYDQLVGKAVYWRGSPTRVPWLGELSMILNK